MGLIDRVSIPALDTGQDNLKRLFLIYLLIVCATHASMFPIVRLAVAMATMTGLFYKPVIREWRYWMIIALAFAGGLFFTYNYSSNHYYLAMYLLVALGISDLKATYQMPAGFNLPRILLAILFLFAILQKLTSPYFGIWMPSGGSRPLHQKQTSATRTS